MGRWLFVVFIVTPIVEMYLLLTVGGLIGALPTIGLVLLTAVIGVSLLRRQGTATLLRAQERMNQGTMPTAEMADGLMLAVAGPLLLTPGFVTDAFGFALLTPPIRRQISAWVAKHLFVQVGRGQGRPGEPFGGSGTRGAGGDTIEGEFERKDLD
ncbi:MAG: FxsA family protein [Pseudomonadota bacterium]